jgi:hypothetical protein
MTMKAMTPREDNKIPAATVSAATATAVTRVVIMVVGAGDVEEGG